MQGRQRGAADPGERVDYLRFVSIKNSGCREERFGGARIREVVEHGKGPPDRSHLASVSLTGESPVLAQHIQRDRHNLCRKRDRFVGQFDALLPGDSGEGGIEAGGKRPVFLSDVDFPVGQRKPPEGRVPGPLDMQPQDLRQAPQSPVVALREASGQRQDGFTAVDELIAGQGIRPSFQGRGLSKERFQRGLGLDRRGDPASEEADRRHAKQAAVSHRPGPFTGGLASPRIALVIRVRGATVDIACHVLRVFMIHCWNDRGWWIHTKQRAPEREQLSCDFSLQEHHCPDPARVVRKS